MSTAPYDYDLIVLGGGSAGLAGAIRAAQHGKRVALLEPGELGGTCVNVGCVPKKAMWLAADLHERIGLASAMGFDVQARPALSWKELVIHRQAYISNIHTSYHKRLDETGVVRIPARGHLLDAHTVACSDGVRHSAEHILIATGAHPLRPDIPARNWAWFPMISSICARHRPRWRSSVAVTSRWSWLACCRHWAAG